MREKFKQYGKFHEIRCAFQFYNGENHHTVKYLNEIETQMNLKDEKIAELEENNINQSRTARTVSQELMMVLKAIK